MPQREKLAPLLVMAVTLFPPVFTWATPMSTTPNRVTLLCANAHSGAMAASAISVFFISPCSFFSNMKLSD